MPKRQILNYCAGFYPSLTTKVNKGQLISISSEKVIYCLGCWPQTWCKIFAINKQNIKYFLFSFYHHWLCFISPVLPFYLHFFLILHLCENMFSPNFKTKPSSASPNPPDFLFAHTCPPHATLHPTLSFFVSFTLSLSQIFGYVCVRSIQSTSRLYVTGSLRTSSSLWRGNLNCSV